MAKSITGIIRLTRYQDYVVQTIIITLMGFLVSSIHFNLEYLPRMFWVLIANLLSVAFAFMINDVEDAPDDAQDKVKAKRNPVSAGLLSPTIGYISSFSIAALSAGIFYFLGPLPFWLGITSIILAALYSWRLMRLKAIPIVDLISHGLMLAGLQLLCAYFALNPYSGINHAWVAPFLFVVAISVRGQLFNQIRDFECDQKAGIKHTTALVGINIAHFLMSTLMVIAAVMFIYGVAAKMIPIWLFLIIMLLSVLFLKKPVVKSRECTGLEKTYNFQNPMLLIGLISLTLWTLIRFL